MLLFAAVLLATLLRAATNGVTHLSRLPDRLALALVLLLAVAGLVALGLLLAPQVASQVPYSSTTSPWRSSDCNRDLGWRR